MAGSAISGGESTWHSRTDAIRNTAPKRKLPLCIYFLPWLIRRIGDGPNVRGYRIDFGPLQCVSVRRHLGGLAESRSPMLDDRGQIGIAYLVQERAIVECMCL